MRTDQALEAPTRAQSARSAGLIRALAGALAIALCTACFAVRRASGILLASDPPGAKILIDGVESGLLTPAHIDVSRDRHRIDLELPGYTTATRWVRDASQTLVVPPIDMAISPSIWRNPLWLEWTAFLFPIKTDRYIRPARIFVRLRTSSEP
jgi:hypothetical protein